MSLAPAPSADLLTPADLCAALKISRRTYARLVACGLPPAVLVQSRRRYRLPDVEAWLRARPMRSMPVRQPASADSTVLADLRELARTWPLRAVGGRR